MLTIEYDGSDSPPNAYFDFLTVTAAQTLNQLLPGIHVSLKYTKAKEGPHLPDIARVGHQLSYTPDTIGESVEPVLRERGWWRQITLRMPDNSREFLVNDPGPLTPIFLVPQLSRGHGATHHGVKSFRANMPRELRYALSIAEDVSRAWTIHSDPTALPELKEALAAQLPLYIVAHIAAEHCFTFNCFGTGRGRHDSLAHTVAKTIGYLDALASSRVEHRSLSHGVVVAPGPRRSPSIGRYPDDFWSLKRTSLLASGDASILWISPQGEPVKWIHAGSRSDPTSRRFRRETFGPLAFVGGVSRALRGIGIALRTDGSIAIFARGRPIFVRRTGRWRGMMWALVRNAIRKRFGAVGLVAFDAAVLLSTNGEGGLLAVVDQIPNDLHDKDRVDLAQKAASVPRSRGRSQRNKPASRLQYPEWLFHVLLPPRGSVVAMGAATLATLAAIDGATVIHKDGALFAYGAVVPSSPSGSEGARTAAGKKLSQHGFVLKVSADGPISVYESGAQLFEA